ncbi:uncharacterized protein VTP21DRAFT_759 [Calcarisporiella thermophila]|uniref:uncharacterized protein n=1 Tax=Calcarisporiella thermophila TaxID=911321 RepID=UPI003743B210
MHPVHKGKLQPLPLTLAKQAAWDPKVALGNTSSPLRIYDYSVAQVTMRSKMLYRRLGNSGLKVSVLSLGSWLSYGMKANQETCIECLKTAYENGVNFFDTAEAYGNGASETTLGHALKKLNWPRNSYVLATKIFFGDGSSKDPNARGLSRKHVIEGLDASLKRLQLDYVDIVFAHRPDPEVGMEEIVRAFDHVIHKGKAFYWGTSEWSAQQITEARAVAQRLGLMMPVVEVKLIFQHQGSARDKMEREYAPLFASSDGLGTTIWSPLYSGILTGKYLQGLPSDSRFATESLPFIQNKKHELFETEQGAKLLEKVSRLQGVAEQVGCSLAQLAIAWCVKNEKVSTVLMGASKAGQLQENMRALEFVEKLDGNIMQLIDNILGNKPSAL